MHLNTLFTQGISPGFFLNLLSIILIDIVLAGDNSVVIAMAVQTLPAEKRTKGIIFGSMAAVLLRVFFTFFAAKMLLMQFVKLAGGALILWIAVKLMDDGKAGELGQKNADTVWKAVWIIIIADITMSLDNVLAVAGASHGNLFLLIFGFGLSVPLVVFTSSLISKLMGKWPVIMWIGAAILGKVGGEMMITDGFIIRNLLEPAHLTEIKSSVIHANHYLVWIVEFLGVAGVILVAWLSRRSKKQVEQPVT
jgi:YjbE family integral membrane protein